MPTKTLRGMEHQSCILWLKIHCCNGYVQVVVETVTIPMMTVYFPLLLRNGEQEMMIVTDNVRKLDSAYPVKITLFGLFVILEHGHCLNQILGGAHLN